MAKSSKFYAVRKGRKTGIFSTWEETQSLVNGYSGAEFKSFLTSEEAENYLNEGNNKSFTPEIIIYTDGGSRNTGNRFNQHVKSSDKAAWAYLIQMNGEKYYDTAGELGATNNRMEIMALVKALNWLKQNGYQDRKIELISDSKYVLNPITNNWLHSWQKRGWRLSSNQPVKNAQLWKQVVSLLKQFPNMQYKWTKGHAKDQGNNFVDHLLNQTMDQMKSRSNHHKDNQTNHSKVNSRLSNVSHRHTKKDDNKNHDSNEIDNSKYHQSIDDIKKNLKQQGFL